MKVKGFNAISKVFYPKPLPVKIFTGDTVIITAGKDKGKTGKVISTDTKKVL